MKPAPFKLQIRFADIDLMKHVNNAVYLSYFEMTRVHYFESLLGQKWNYHEDGFLLARNEIDYLQPVFLHDKPEIHMFTEEIGNKSFSLSYEIHVDGQIKTKGKSIMVSFNSVENKTIPIPVKLLEALEILKK